MATNGEVQPPLPADVLVAIAEVEEKKLKSKIQRQKRNIREEKESIQDTLDAWAGLVMTVDLVSFVWIVLCFMEEKRYVK